LKKPLGYLDFDTVRDLQKVRGGDPEQAVSAEYGERVSLRTIASGYAVYKQMPRREAKRKQNPCGCAERKPNPVPPSRRVQIQNASKLYSDFTGHDATEQIEVDKPETPDVMLVVGDVDGVMYTTVRDGVTEKYVHTFKKSCRPLLAVSSDGTQLHMLGGSYDFTERGIVDRSKS